MLPETTPKLTTAELLHLIEEARNVELCKDLDSLRKILQSVWNIEDTPNFGNYDEAIKAELLRLCGVFLSFYGFARNLKDYQIRGKNLLINAVEIFEAMKISDKAAEAKINLAFCYWSLGEVSEFETILNIVETEFGKNLLHPTYLRICVNRLLIYFWKQEPVQAIKIIEEITVPMQFCTDLRLQAMFHNQAGIFYRASKKYDKAGFHLNEAIRFSKKVNNRFFIAINLNNLAYLYKELKDFQKAFDCISKSLDEVNKIKYQGFLPHALDTKALIYLDWNKSEKALATIEQSIEHFRQGEDYRGLTDALWTKVRCLIRLERAEDAFFTFAELERVALDKIGEVAAKKFAKNLTEEVYALKHISLTDEVSEFKKARISAALIEANGGIAKAAKILRFKTHQALSDILNKQFPELLGELGFKRRARRGSRKAKSESEDSHAILLEKFQIHQEREISRLVLRDKNFSFDFHFSSEKFETFYFDKFQMQKFGIKEGSIVAVIPVEEFSVGQMLLISREDGFIAAKVEYDDWAKIYFISDDSGLPMPLGEENIVGAPVGYCLTKAVDNKFIEFSRL
jgi:tetratricopeptide (TPR) repeat protein